MRKLFALILCVASLSGCAGVRQRWADTFHRGPNRIASAWLNPESRAPDGYSNVAVDGRGENENSDAEARQKQFSKNAEKYHAANPPPTEMPAPPGGVTRWLVNEVYQSNNDLNDAEDRNEENFGSAYPQGY